jgi:hypothetical protein
MRLNLPAGVRAGDLTRSMRAYLYRVRRLDTVRAQQEDA